jgi:ATPase subunit of ABC transporter with duplicated ATPase domains
VYEQAQKFNLSALQEHEIKIRLNRFLFTKEYWDKPCSALSGGEKMRLMLCCLTIRNQAPDMIILDEPTNNLDMQNIEILTAAINEYKGTLIVVSHDQYFLEQVNVERTMDLE